MNAEEKQTHELLEELLKRKDPALVKVRKILRSKNDSLSSTKSFSSHSPEVFSIDSKEKSRENESIFSNDELREVELSKVVSECEERLRQKDAQIEQIRQQAFDDGKVEGIEECQDRIRESVVEIEEKLKTEIQEWRAGQIALELNERDKYFKTLENDIYSAVISIAKKILDAEINTNHNLIIDVIKKAISHISQRDGITIRVSKDDYEHVNSQISSFNRHTDGAYAINIVEDEHIRMGGCLIETESTIVDAQIEKRYDKIFDLVEKIWVEICGPEAFKRTQIEEK
jgi:flagellar assembly protein FliH